MPSPFDTTELLDPAQDRVAPLPYPNDFGTMSSEAMIVFSEHEIKTEKKKTFFSIILRINITPTMILISGVIGSPEPDPEKPQDNLQPEQLSPNNSAPDVTPDSSGPSVTQQTPEQETTTTIPAVSTAASEQTDLNVDTTTAPTTEPKRTAAYDNPEIPVSESDGKYPQPVSEQLSDNTSVPIVPLEMALTTINPIHTHAINSTPTSDHSVTTNSQSTSELKPTPSATAQANHPDLNPSDPVQSEDKPDPEVNLKNQTEAQSELSDNTTLGRPENQTMVSPDTPAAGKIIEEQNENQDVKANVSTKASPTYPALIESTPNALKVSTSPATAEDKPTKPEDANNNHQGLQDYQAGENTRSLFFSLTLYTHHCANNLPVISEKLYIYVFQWLFLRNMALI